jgi:hypothetical protein
VVGRYGFMEQPDAPDLVLRSGLLTKLDHVTFFLGREHLMVAEHAIAQRWRIALFVVPDPQFPAGDTLLQHPAGSGDGDWNSNRALKGSLFQPSRSRSMDHAPCQTIGLEPPALAAVAWTFCCAAGLRGRVTNAVLLTSASQPIPETLDTFTQTLAQAA